MRFGAHVPTRGRLSRAIDYALDVGAQTIQLFVSNPRAWSPPPVRDDDELRAFDEGRRAAGIGPVFVHSSYLINIASPDPSFLARSIELAGLEREAAATIGADGLVVHSGAGGSGEPRQAVERAAGAVAAILGATSGLDLVLELTAGGAGAVASTIPQAAELLEAVRDEERVALCLDTCHLLSAGYPLNEPGVMPTPFEELRRFSLDSRVRVLHANDSRDPPGSRRDRHTHVGEGTIGEDGFRAILADPVVLDVPILIETPGHEEEDRRNIAALRRLSRV